MPTYAIQFEQVSKVFPKNDQPAVQDASLNIEAGEFVTILGTSGSGKTTLLKMVNRIYERTSGRIFVEGKNNDDIPLTELRRKIGYVIQQIGLFPHMTVADNIATVPKILKWDKNKVNARVDFLLQLVDLAPSDYRKRYPSQLSGGQQQRIGIARAMASDPAILLMDEPFGALDAITRAGLQEELLKIQKKLHKTILFVTHDIDEALKLGDKVVVMHEGKIQQYDTPLNILMNPANDFVSRLVQSEDVLKLLDFIKAESAMQNGVEAGHATVPSVKLDDSLKHVLTLMLKNRVDAVVVHNEEKQPVGAITFSQLMPQEQLKQSLLISG